MAGGSDERLRVLVIDDEALVGRVIRRALEPQFDTVVATGGAQAMELVRSGQRFDAVLCDLQMPGMSGAEVCAALEHEAPALRRRTIVMTGGFGPPPGLEVAWVAKPFDMQALVDAVMSVAARAASDEAAKPDGGPSAG